MKILSVRFANLNSLEGEWFIDFEHEAYDDGIFLISGPTGAGKSTILDAIALGLYGKTPRLGSITRSNDEIMTKGASFCFSEVAFASMNQRFKVRFECVLNKAKQWVSTSHVVLTDNGTVDGERKKDTLAFVEEKTKMDFARFTKSVLLAQGAFNSFLSASSDEKSKILEQITGTSIYSEISRRVFERHKGEKMALDMAMQMRAGIQVMSDTEIMVMKHRLSDVKSKIASLLDELGKLEDEEEKTRQYHVALAEFEAAQARMNDIWSKASAFSARRKEAEKAERAMRVEWIWHAYEAAKNAMESTSLAIASIENDMTTFTLEKAQIEKDMARAKTDYDEAMAMKSSLADALDRAFVEEEQIKAAALNIAEKEASLKAALAEKDDIILRIGNIEKEIAQEYRSMKDGQDWVKTFNELKIAEMVDDVVHGMVMESSIKKQEEEISRLNAEIQSRTSEKMALEKEIKAHEEKINQSSDVISSIESGFGDGYERASYLLEIKRLAHIVSLVEKDAPCPLCGQMVHEAVEMEMPEDMGAQPNILHRLMQERQSLVTAKALLEVKTQAKSILEEEISRMRVKITRLEEDMSPLIKKTKDILENGNVRLVALNETAKENLKACHDALRRLMNKKEQIEASLKQSMEKTEKLEREKAFEKAKLEGKVKSVESMRDEIKAMKHAVEKKQQWLDSVCNGQSPRAMKMAMEEKINKASSALSALEKKLQEKNQVMAMAKGKLSQLQSSFETQKTEAEKKKEEFEEALKEQGFTDLSDLIASVMPVEAIMEIRNEAKQLDAQMAIAESSFMGKSAVFTSMQKAMPFCRSLEAIEADIRETHEKLMAFESEQMEIESTLAFNAEQQRQLTIADEKVNALVKTVAQWKRLNDLIGSSKGHAYRNFAQMLTFDMLLDFANEKMAQMTDRYVLIKGEDVSPMDIMVIDQWRGGEIRLVKNLSGGETFMVSLALAFALSAMTSEQVSVDSFFLDEGFGTLDEETLRLAIDAISSMKQEGKLVGIVSHVQALKESIPTRLDVVMESKGKSRIEGPGVSRIS